MIKIKSGENEHVLKPTIFPDNTSQVWNLPEWIYKNERTTVTWFFENEAEMFYIKQLSDLLYPLTKRLLLTVPYFPYARQDKEIDNKSSFARKSFLDILNQCPFDHIQTVDVHSKLELNRFENRDVKDFHAYVLKEMRPDFVVFPDAGAAKRYPYLLDNPHIVFEKKRDSTTGEIISHTPVDPMNVKSGDSFLMVDDLCDGGATFCSISKTLHSMKQNIGVHLAVTHGLFSKGKHVLGAAGINEIFTTNTLLRNKDGFKVV